MNLFGRKNTDAIPEDLQPYYAPEKSGARRMLGLVGGILLGLLVVGLVFLGGRWVVDKLSDNDANSTASQTSEQATDEAAAKAEEATRKAAEAAKVAEQKAKATAEAEKAKQAEAAKKAEEARKKAEAVAAAPAPAPTPTSTPTPAPVPTPTPTPPISTPPAATPQAPQVLANAGPGEAALLFIGTLIAGTIFHRFFVPRKAS